MPSNDPFIQEPARLEFEDVSVGYNGTPVLEGVTFHVPHGAQVAVVGPNGAGKSTLFKALVGLLPVKSGRVLIHRLPLHAHQDCIAYVPQRSEIDFRFPVTVRDVVMMGRYRRAGWFARASAADAVIVERCLRQMGMLELANRPIGELSGGQQQRVFLARALAQEPHILLMDEPFTGVDAATQEVTLALLDELKAQQVTVMVSTHDLNMAARRFEWVMLLNRRLVAFGAPEQALSHDAIHQAFGDHVLVMGDRTMIVDDCCGKEE